LTVENFTPYSALAGGIMIGLGAALVLGLMGRIAGISGILNAVMEQRGSNAHKEREWRVLFLIGLPLGAFVAALSNPEVFAFDNQVPAWALVAGGLLVGYGTRMGSGCTSGHGVCGVGRFSKRSVVATVVFVGTGMLTVFVMRLAGVTF